MLKRIIKFLSPKVKPVVVARENVTIVNPEDIHLVRHIMDWCAHSAMECDAADWFVDVKFQVHVSDYFTLTNYKWCVRTSYRDYKLPYSEEEREYLRTRLTSKAFAMIIHMIDCGVWESSRINVIALCIAVADVTEDLNFIFNGKSDVAHRMFQIALDFSVNNKGLLSDLCRLT